LQKRAFTLIELLIVVIIIGVVYSLAVTKLQKVGDATASLSLKTLKSYLFSLEFEKESRLICFEDCSSCDIYLDGKIEKKLSKNFDDFIDDSIKVYRYEHLSGFEELEPELFFNDEDNEENVCFSFSIDKKGVSDQVIVEYKEKTYDFTPFTKEPKIYNNLDDVAQEREKLYQEVLK
jgi:prepilin-type N-terminal cleavage/methylation domain-containing protein